ncbi:helix-turn-helix domain-containing protein [Thomasclavelia cocleata]|uniref:helix-turn-helix domain-containing protein n=1 Tax=Thomasclavelia cocleata TaxID=69824 RepID=UPI002574BBA9|nr:helix-turn-helix domain-containing protein [Thomasclavelia cocleata]
MTDLKMLTQDELSELINVSRDQITMLREVGIIRATKTGKCYMFSQAEIKRFQRDYAGLDVSNKVKALESYKKVNGIN